MKQYDSILNRIGRTFKRAMKNYARGMPEKKIFIRPSSKKYIHLPKQEKREENKKRTGRLFYRKELQ